MENKLLDITVPSLGERTESAVITGWHKELGEWVAFDDLLYDLSTDKVEIEVPAPSSGELAEILFEVGSKVRVGSVIARLKLE
jgi:pyruvate/2-oxoglutarate dehydrogenase complex dihydrolipoamide acyltransferase (E2) component